MKTSIRITTPDGMVVEEPLEPNGNTCVCGKDAVTMRFYGSPESIDDLCVLHLRQAVNMAKKETMNER